MHEMLLGSAGMVSRRIQVLHVHGRRRASHLLRTQHGAVCQPTHPTAQGRRSRAGALRVGEQMSNGKGNAGADHDDNNATNAVDGQVSEKEQNTPPRDAHANMEIVVDRMCARAA